MSNSLQPCGLYSPCNSSCQNTGVGNLSLLQGIFPTQGSNPGLPHCRRILDRLSHKGGPRILEWVAYPFSRGSSNPGIKLGSPALQADSLSTELSGKPLDRTDTIFSQFLDFFFIFNWSISEISICLTTDIYVTLMLLSFSQGDLVMLVVSYNWKCLQIEGKQCYLSHSN